MRPFFFTSLLLIGHLATSVAGWAQAAVKLPERAIRRDIPITNSIAKALKAGTRDSSGRPGRAYWQLWTDYTINARLETATSTIEGQETIVIRNQGKRLLSTIAIRLDHNIFRPTAQRGAVTPAESTEGMVVTQLSINGRALDLTKLRLDQTLVWIDLPAAVAPDSLAKIEVAWRTKLPGGSMGHGHRMTMRWGDTLYQPTQWYPRLAKLDDLGGWDTERYLGPAEFYNNFGRFDVRLDVPAGWLVSGTGVLQNPEEVLTPTARERLERVSSSDETITIVDAKEVASGQATAMTKGRLVWHFLADTVNDFAWATSKKFVWQATRATIPGKGLIPIHMFYLPERAPLFAIAGRVTRHALEFYSKLLTPYPFPQLTLQDGPSTGMEYPMAINANQSAADHETAHQWWPMMVGTNETWYGWMDEGFDEYVNLLSTRDTIQSANVFDNLGQQYGNTSGDEREPPLMWNANYAGPRYAFQAYAKVPQMLSMLGGIVGDSAVIRAIRDYTEAWRFKHPSPWDFMFFMNGALKQDLGWFWYYWLFTTESVDGGIESVTTAGKRTSVTVRQDGQMPSPVVLRVELASSGAPITPMPNATMTDSTTARVAYPVNVWFAGNRTFIATLDFGGREIEKITLDPDGRFPDRDTRDNIWRKDRPRPQPQPRRTP